MTSIIGTRAAVKCARCSCGIVLHDAIRRHVDWQGEWIMVLYPPYMINTGTVTCIDCEQDDDYIEALFDSEPPMDDHTSYMIINHYRGI